MDPINASFQERTNTTETLLMYGGVALMILGAGMVLTNPTIRKATGLVGAGGLIKAALPDLQRYLKLKAM
jgi:hypothetical protein